MCKPESQGSSWRRVAACGVMMRSPLFAWPAWAGVDPRVVEQPSSRMSSSSKLYPVRCRASASTSVTELEARPRSPRPRSGYHCLALARYTKGDENALPPSMSHSIRLSSHSMTTESSTSMRSAAFQTSGWSGWSVHAKSPQARIEEVRNIRRSNV